MGTTDASALNLRVYKMRSGRIDYDAILGQASFGYGAAKNTWLSSNTTYGGLYNNRGTKNTAFGYEALTSTNVGRENTALGYRALKNNNSYNGMVAVGFEAMANFTDMVEGNFYSNPGAYGLQYGSSYEAYNTAVGYQALKGSAAIQNNNGTYNTALGYQAMTLNTSGSSNTAIGTYSLANNSSGSNNVALGLSALYSNTTNSYNTAVGYEGLRSSTGTFNTSLGFQAGYYGTATTSGNYNTFIGAYAYANNAGYSNATAIGYNAVVTNNNTIQLGNGSIADVFTTGNYNTTNAFLSTLGTDATSATAGGALRIAGGAAIAKKLYVGSDAAVAGIMSVKNATASSAYNNGSLVVDGGVGIAGVLNVNGAQNFTGATTLSSTLTVAGVSTFNNNV
ncbi:MAG: hypothetical protein EBT89_12425, partial [Opitutaceae bacterium]|nr:hypothetical protein [Opitutaceae bacterium]